MIIGKNIGVKKPDNSGRISLPKTILDQIGYNPKTDFFKIEKNKDTLILRKLTLKATSIE